MHFVPENFSVNAISIGHAWLLWCVGDAPNGISAYRALTTADLPVATRSHFSRLKAVCLFVEHLARLVDDEGDVSRHVFNITQVQTIAQAMEIHSAISTSLCTVLGIAHDQLPNTKVATVYNKLITLRPEGFLLQSRKRRRIGDGR
jgi:hypothetical protein